MAPMVIPQQPSHSEPAYRNPTFDSFNVAAERQTGRYGDKPFVTWYDDHRDERVELSYKTFDNWVAKTANLLVDELGAEPGDRVGALVDDHWQAPIVLAACWRAGLGVTVLDPADTAPPPDLVAAFVREEQLAAAETALDNLPVVALTAGLFGRPERDLGRALNFSRIVPSMGDVFETGPDPAGDALIAIGETATMTDLLGRAAALADRTGLRDADRLLSGRRLLTADGAAAGLLAPLLRGAGVVRVANLDPARFWKRLADERVTVAVLDPDQAAAVQKAGPDDPSHLRILLID
jgi:uncharacterized protein (TIGR03089 family)